jgi:hypothetical protein
MRDVQDLDSAWRLLEQRADAHSYEYRPELPPPPRGHWASRWRWPLVAGASAAVVAIAVAVPVLIGGNGGDGSAPTVATHRHSTSAAAPRPTASAADNAGWGTVPKNHYLFVLDRMPGTRITSVIGVGPNEGGLPHDDTYQEIQTHGPHGNLVFKVNAPGAWAPPTDVTRATVAGRPAYYGRFLLHPEIPGHPVHARVALAWQYVPGSWVTVADMSEQPIPLAKALHIADLVRIGDGGPIPNPPPGG